MIYQVYEKYNKDFTRFARSLVNLKQDAQDLVQDAYVKAIEHEEMFTSMNEYEIKGWFFRVIKNNYIDKLRKDKKMFLSDNERILTNQTNMQTDIIFYEIINDLPEHLRTLLELKYVRGLNSKEIGRLLNISASTIRTRLSLAINKLRDGGLYE